MAARRTTGAIVACAWLVLPAAAQTEVLRPTGPVDSCATAECHTKVMANRVMHGPTAQKQCEACHVTKDIGQHTYDLVVPRDQLCSYCHTKTERSVVHKPVADKDCDKCHDPHGSDHALQLLAEPSGPLCFTCHNAEDYAGMPHGGDETAQAGACNVCHAGHSSWLPRLLPKTRDELCLFCHEAFRERLELLGRSHAPVLEGRCLECHNAHPREHAAQLRERAPRLCFSCHEHDNIKELVEGARTVHGALNTERSCIACHGGHGGVMPALLIEDEKSLCLSCHNEPVPTEDGRVLADIAYLLKENPRHHGPIRNGLCTPCHEPHASPHLGLLTMEYPEAFYAPFASTTYALCFQCHIEELVTSELGIGTTGFRDTERNLHFLHVKKDKRGRTCRACHEVHASNRPFHIRDTVPFGPGGWLVEINHVRLPNGGRCSPGCHDAKVYDRGEGGAIGRPRSGLKPELLIQDAG